MRVSKWGNSLAIRLPATVVDALGLSEGDDVKIVVMATRTIAVARNPVARELLAQLRKYRGRMPLNFEFDRLGTHGRD